MLNSEQKRKVYKKTCNFVDCYNEINTRELARRVVSDLRKEIPELNIYHVFGYVSWMLSSCNDNGCYVLNPRKPGASHIKVKCVGNVGY